MRDLSARLALMAVALTKVGRILLSTMAPSNRGPKNGTWGGHHHRREESDSFEGLYTQKQGNKQSQAEVWFKAVSHIITCNIIIQIKTF